MKFIIFENFFFSVPYLRVFQAQLLGQLLAIWFADVLLDLKALLQPLPLSVGEDGASHHATTRFTSRGSRPWK